MNSSQNPRQEQCRFYKKGLPCKFGDSCWFQHSGNVSTSKLTQGPLIRPTRNANLITKRKNNNNNNYPNDPNNNNSYTKTHKNSKKLITKNTETFNPSHVPADLRIVVENVEPNQSTTKMSFQTQDVVVVPNLFGNSNDLTIYHNLLKEMQESGIDENSLWKLWHGNTHLIADDHLNYKEKIPTFMMVINKLKEYFGMDIKASRFNWFRDDKDWKPFHHDASAVNPEKAKIQNFTVGVSFGATREVAFEDALNPKRYRRIVSVNLPNATTYAFTRDINTNWRHGIPQLPPEKQGNLGRISIIAWGSVSQNTF